MALVAVIGIAYIYAKNEGYEPLSAGVMSLVVFLLTTNSICCTPKDAEVCKCRCYSNKIWIGGQGMITAIIIGLVVGSIYSWFMKKDITIKMPDGVPQGVANAFSALIPAAVIFIGATVVYAVFKFGLNTTFVELIYKVIQTPLQGVSDSLPGVIVIAFCIPFLWFFGVHGATVVGGIVTGILTANTVDNAAILQSGRELRSCTWSSYSNSTIL